MDLLLLFQCPHGLELLLIMDGMPVQRIRFNALSGLSCYFMIWLSAEMKTLFQCPLGLIPHFYATQQGSAQRKNNVVSMPSRAYTSFLPTGMSGRVDVYIVSMPSRAYTSFLRYPFKNLGFMRFTEPVFAGIYQNILTTAVFRAC